MGRIVRGVAGLIGAVRQSRRVSRPARYTPVQLTTSYLSATQPWKNWIIDRSIDLLLERTAFQIQEG